MTPYMPTMLPQEHELLINLTLILANPAIFSAVE